jgi:hypothetical protein
LFIWELQTFETALDFVYGRGRRRLSSRLIHRGGVSMVVIVPTKRYQMTHSLASGMGIWLCVSLKGTGSNPWENDDST